MGRRNAESAETNEKVGIYVLTEFIVVGWCTTAE